MHLEFGDRLGGRLRPDVALRRALHENHCRSREDAQMPPPSAHKQRGGHTAEERVQATRVAGLAFSSLFECLFSVSSVSFGSLFSRGVCTIWSGMEEECTSFRVTPFRPVCPCWRRRPTFSKIFITCDIVLQTANGSRVFLHQLARSTPVPGTFCGRVSSHRSSRFTKTTRAGLAARCERQAVRTA